MSKKITVAIILAVLISLPAGVSYFAGKDSLSGMSANKAVAFYHNTSPDCNDHV